MYESTLTVGESNESEELVFILVKVGLCMAIENVWAGKTFPLIEGEKLS